MSLFGKFGSQLRQQIRAWFSNENQRRGVQIDVLQELMLMARRAQYAEQYDESVRLLDQAAYIAHERHDSTTQIDVLLNKADALMFQGHYDDAETLLNALHSRTEATNHRAPLAYTLCSLGVLAQSRGDWDIARQRYEEAQELAKQAMMQGAEGRASGRLADLYLREGNASYAQYLLRQALDNLKASGDTELIPYFLGRLAETELASGRVTEGVGLLHQALEAANAMQHRYTIRYLNRVLGQQALDKADYGNAYKHLSIAADLYRDAPPQWHDHILVLCQLVLAALKMEHHEKALKWARQAVDSANAHGDAALKAKSQAVFGMALRHNGDHKEAQTVLGIAAESYVGLPTDTFHVALLRELAIVQDDEKQVLARYQQALKAADEAQLLPSQAQLYTDLGNYYLHHARYDESVQHLIQAADLYETLGHYNQVARVYCDLGHIRLVQGEGKRGIKAYERAMELLTRIDDDATRGLVMANVALAIGEQGDIETAESFFTEAIAIADTLGHVRVKARRLGNYGRFLAITNRPKRAITEIMHARNLSDEQGMTLQSVIQTDNLGLAYSIIGQPQKALALHQEALERILHHDEPRWQATIQANSAGALLALQRYDDAQALLNDVLPVARDLNDTALLVQTLTLCGDLARVQGDYEAAQIYLHEAAQLAQRAYLRRLLAGVHVAQSRLYAATGHASEAQAEWEQADYLIRILHLPPVTPDAKDQNV